ncbi:hypothetical protein KAX17_14760 [Candidatus Bipolaricaulota bacterium]|nr:hypothetical protein [Candidatus Bipolaricaulota bacterium]
MLTDTGDRLSKDRESCGSLFSAGEDWRLNACVNYATDDLYAYAEGYKQASDVLVAHILSEGATGIDFLVYPLVFLCRHAIELQLKGAIRDGERLLNRPRTRLEHHKIDSLWRAARTVLEEVWPEGDESLLRSIDDVLTQFSSVDPSSQAFRYPVDRKGKRTKPDLTHINLLRFHQLASTVYKLLDGATTGLDAYLSETLERERMNDC